MAPQVPLDQPLHERPNTRTWLITGASSGLGHALGAAILEPGDNVVVTVHQPEAGGDLVGGYSERTLAVPLDVTEWTCS